MFLPAISSNRPASIEAAWYVKHGSRPLAGLYNFPGIYREELRTGNGDSSRSRVTFQALSEIGTAKLSSRCKPLTHAETTLPCISPSGFVEDSRIFPRGYFSLPPGLRRPTLCLPTGEPGYVSRLKASRVCEVCKVYPRPSTPTAHSGTSVWIVTRCVIVAKRSKPGELLSNREFLGTHFSYAWRSSELRVSRN